MSRSEGGGLVYFGRDRATGHVVGLQLESGRESSLVITTTQFAPIDPTIQLSVSRQPSAGQIARRVSVPKTPVGQSAQMSRSAAEAMNGGPRRIRTMSIVIAAVVIAVVVFELMRLI
jgi:hypothetical protein